MHGVPSSTPSVDRYSWRDRRAATYDLNYPCMAIDYNHMSVNNALTLATGSIYLFSFCVPEAQIIPKVRSRCRFTQAGKTVGYGIYACGTGTSLAPGALLAEVNGLAQTLGWVDGVFNYSAPAGTRLYIGITCGDVAYFTKFYAVNQGCRGLAWTSDDIVNDLPPRTCFVGAHAYNGVSMPNPLPALTITTDVSGTGYNPGVWVGGY